VSDEDESIHRETPTADNRYRLSKLHGIVLVMDWLVKDGDLGTSFKTANKFKVVTNSTVF
jgi:hypothetical protein